MTQTVHQSTICATVVDLAARSRSARSREDLTDADYFLEQLRAAIASKDTAMTRVRDRVRAECDHGSCRIHAFPSD